MATTTTPQALRRNEHHDVPIVSGTYASCEVVAIGDGRIGIVEGLEALTSSDTASAAVTGQFDLLCNATSDTYSVGDSVWWDNTNNVAKTAYAEGYLYAGRAVKAKASGSSYVYTDINVGPGSNATNKPVSLTAATYTLTSSDFGREFQLNKSGGIGITLPAATGTGGKMRFRVGTVSTTGYTFSTAPATDIFAGSLPTLSDGANAVLAWTPGGTDNKITLNGTTTGGVAVGDWIELMDAASGVWNVAGFTTSSGSEATPYSHV